MSRIADARKPDSRIERAEPWDKGHRRDGKDRENQEGMMMEGSCHCGTVRWRFAGVPESATACNCSICRRLGALWAYDFEGERISVSGETQAYAWGRKWLEFHFCPQCACVVYWRAVRARRDGRRPMGFNLRLAAPDVVQAIALVHHDTETMSDLPRDGRCVSDVWS